MNPENHIRISLPLQTLELIDGQGELMRRYPVSTALNGAGEAQGSHCTPRGRHVVRAKIGAGLPENTVFIGRRPSGEIWTPELAKGFPERDWILSRILWLSGKEPGRNRLGDVDSMRRYIYVHGTPDDQPMGQKRSHGCVRMRNRDVIELFELVEPYTPVDIVEFGVELGRWTSVAAGARVVREAVFVAEQGVPAELEMDSHDEECSHVLAVDATGCPIGTGRLLPDGHIGRMAVLAAWRRCGVGRALLERLFEEASRSGISTLRLNAQVGAIDFYRRFGFIEHGPEFVEAGLRHRAMRRER